MEDLTVGRWFHSLSPLQRRLFDLVSWVIGDDRAIDLFGYGRWKRKQMK